MYELEYHELEKGMAIYRRSQAAKKTWIKDKVLVTTERHVNVQKIHCRIGGVLDFERHGPFYPANKETRTYLKLLKKETIYE